MGGYDINTGTINSPFATVNRAYLLWDLVIHALLERELSRGGNIGW